MTDPLDLTPSERERWVHARSKFDVDLRRPEPEETMLSDSEIWHGVRFGDFDCSTTSRARSHLPGGAA